MPSDPQPGEIWVIDFEPKRGAEQGKKRPGVVVNVDRAGKLPLRMIVPITHSQNRSDKHFWFVPIPANKTNGLTMDSEADAFQCKSFSLERFVFKVGSITDDQLLEIRKAVVLCLGLTAV